MKQTITVEQLNELSDKSRNKLITWMMPTLDKTDPAYIRSDLLHLLLSIGQMIEFLGESIKNLRFDYEAEFSTIEDPSTDFYHEGEELVDALWEAVKEVLTND